MTCDICGNDVQTMRFVYPTSPTAGAIVGNVCYDCEYYYGDSSAVAMALIIYRAEDRGISLPVDFGVLIDLFI